MTTLKEGLVFRSNNQYSNHLFINSYNQKYNYNHLNKTNKASNNKIHWIHANNSPNANHQSIPLTIKKPRKDVSGPSSYY